MSITITLIIQGLAFFAVAWLVMTFGWPHIMGAIEERQKKIADGLAAADRGNRSLDDAQKKIAQLDADARARAQALIAETEKRAQAMIDEAKSQAKVEGDRVIAAAKAEAEQEMVRAKDTLRDQVAVLAVAGAEQILKREVNPQVHAELLGQLKAKL